MTPYEIALEEAKNYTDRDAYVSDLSLSSVWGDLYGAEEIPAARIEWLSSIWDALHRSVRDIASDAGMSQRALARRFSVPYRTMEDWCRGASGCPVYVRLMMQECLGLVRPAIRPWDS